MVRTAGFQSANRSSILRGPTNYSIRKPLQRFFGLSKAHRTPLGRFPRIKSTGFGFICLGVRQRPPKANKAYAHSPPSMLVSYLRDIILAKKDVSDSGASFFGIGASVPYFLNRSSPSSCVVPNSRTLAFSSRFKVNP